MSLATSFLLAFLPAIVRPKPEGEKSARELKLEAELKLARRDLDVMRSELDLAWAERDSALRRLDEARDMLTRVARERLGPPLAAAQMQNALAQQAHALMNQQAQMQMAQYQAAQNAGPYCHCVPGRHEALLGGALGA